VLVTQEVTQLMTNTMSFPAGKPQIVFFDWDETLSQHSCDAGLTSAEWLKKFGGEARLRRVQDMLQRLVTSDVVCYIISRNVYSNLIEGLYALSLHRYFLSPDDNFRVVARAYPNDFAYMQNKGTRILELLREEHSGVRSCWFADDEPGNISDVQEALEGVVHCTTILCCKRIGLTDSDMQVIEGSCCEPSQWKDDVQCVSDIAALTVTVVVNALHVKQGYMVVEVGGESIKVQLGADALVGGVIRLTRGSLPDSAWNCS